MKIPAAICTSLILAAAQPFATAQGGAAPPATPSPAGIGAGGPPPIIFGGAPPSTTPPIGIGAGRPPASIPGGGAPLPPTAPPAGIGASGLPSPVPVPPLPNPPVEPRLLLKVAPGGAPAPGAMIAPVAGGAPMAANPGTGFSTFIAPSAAPAALPGMPGNAGNYPVPSAVPAPPPGQPGYHNHASNFYYESMPVTSAAPSPRTGQEIIRAAKLRVLERHYEETLNQMIQLEKDALTAPPEERAKMEASAQAMRAFLTKLEADLMPLADRPKNASTSQSPPSATPRMLGIDAAPRTETLAPPPVIDPPKQATPERLDPVPRTPGGAAADPTAPAPKKSKDGEALRAAYEKLERAHTLYREGAMSEQDFITAQRDFSIAVAQGNQVKVAEAHLTEAKQFFDLAERNHLRIDRPDTAAAELEAAQQRLLEAQKQLERARDTARQFNRQGM